MEKRRLIFGFLFLMIFILFTYSLTCIDVQAIGPNEAFVGYAKINKAVHSLIGVHLTMYTITDWAGAAALIIPFIFAAAGLKQWIKRKSILKVDKDILCLGIFYLTVFLAYIFFEKNIINRRPVLILGVHEASYPSSTTLLSLCTLTTAIKQTQIRVKNPAFRAVIIVFLNVFAAFLVIGRLISGVHWFTDIIGSVLLSASLVCLYFAGIDER